MTGIKHFVANTNGVNPKTCDVDSDARTCIISNLTAHTGYDVFLRACDNMFRQCSLDISESIRTLPGGKQSIMLDISFDAG